ncbi:MAG: DUF5666 domain-containing protein [Candidatus Dormibacteria bacterium]
MTVAALAGVLLASQRPATALTGTGAAAASTAAPNRGAGAEHRRGGAEGTVTGISGTSLTVRTLRGDLTVNTDSSTTCMKEGKSIAFNELKVNDVIRVRPQHAGGATPPASPPTTITAAAIDIVMPTLFGRVTQVQGPTIFIVTRDGSLAYIYTTSSTTYRMNGSSASLSDVKPGTYVMAEGPRNDLAHLTADGVNVSTTPKGGHGGHGGHPPGKPAPSSSGAAT